ncbi:hypothetical protein EXT47_18480 [Pseudoalteromonas sp. CO342X]|nr:hypothetical protein EXT47_18480 [Pseudoalteromonas sp. CO342X]
MEVNSTQLALKLAARKALIIRSSGYLGKGPQLDRACWLGVVLRYMPSIIHLADNWSGSPWRFNSGWFCAWLNQIYCCQN